MWRVLLFLAAVSSCHALSVGVASRSPLAASASLASNTAPRACAPVLKRTAEEKDVLELEGTVLEAMRGASFRVELDDTQTVILATISGKIRKFRIKVLVGDRVTVEVSPYDLTKGRITFRKR